LTADLPPKGLEFVISRMGKGNLAYMPPFAGNSEERKALASYLAGLRY